MIVLSHTRLNCKNICIPILRKKTPKTYDHKKSSFQLRISAFEKRVEIWQDIYSEQLTSEVTVRINCD